MKEFTLLMALLMSIVAISIDAMLPALGAIATDLQVTEANHVQYVIGIIFTGMAIGQLVCGPLSDAWGRKRLLYAGIGFYLAGSILCYFAASLPVLLLGRFIQGLGVAGPYVSAVSIVRDKYEGRDMARIMSLIMMIFMMVPAIAPSLGQAILFVASWHAIFLLYIAYALVIGLWICFRLPETLPPARRIPFTFANLAHGFKAVLGCRTTFCYTLCMGIVFASLIGYISSCQQIFQAQFGVGDSFALYFGGLAVVLGVSSLVNARLVPRLGMRYICLRAILAITVASALFLLLHALTAITLWMFLGYAAVLFFCFGLMFGNLNAMAMEPMGHMAGIASAVIGSLSSVISMVVGSQIGQLYDGTLRPLTAGFFVLGLLAFGILRYAARQPHPQPVV